MRNSHVDIPVKFCWQKFKLFNWKFFLYFLSGKIRIYFPFINLATFIYLFCLWTYFIYPTPSPLPPLVWRSRCVCRRSGYGLWFIHDLATTCRESLLSEIYSRIFNPHFQFLLAKNRYLQKITLSGAIIWSTAATISAQRGRSPDLLRSISETVKPEDCGNMSSEIREIIQLLICRSLGNWKTSKY